MNKERLLKLADHLQSGSLGHKRFDYGTLNKGATKDNPCGTSGCAVGECPIIFSEWKFLLDQDGYYIPKIPGILETKSSNASFSSAMYFFDITEEEAEYLFIGSYDDYEDDEIPLLVNNKEFKRISETSSKEEVAKHIRNFVKLKESE